VTTVTVDILKKLVCAAPLVAAMTLGSAPAFAQEEGGGEKGGGAEGGGEAGGGKAGGGEGGGAVAFFNFGFIGTHSWSDDLTANGVGAEASIAIYPPKTGIHFGFYGQGQVYGSTAEASPTEEPVYFGRLAAGVQFGFGGIGTEVGWAYVSPSGGLPATHGVQIAHYLSCGILLFSPRVTYPVGDTGRAIEYGLTAGIKIPFLMGGNAGSKFPVGAFVGKAPAPPQGGPHFAMR
jgi:hypothetical protein